MLVSVHKDYDDREFASGLDQSRSVHAASPRESGDRMKRRGTGDVLLPQVSEDFQMQRLMVPFIRLVQIERDLDCHSVANSTAVSVSRPSKD